MRHISLRLLVASSLLLASTTSAETRPHYGGSLRVQIQEAPVSLDPTSTGDSPMWGSMSRLIFDTLTTLDERGVPQPALAVAWQSAPGGERWDFQLRDGVKFYDGTPVSADMVAASLRAANSAWKISGAGNLIVIESDSSLADLPSELALARNGIAERGAGKVLGSGPFVVTQWNPGKSLTLAAREDYWGGRAFLNSIEIQMARAFRDQMTAFDLNQTDVVEVAPDQARRLSSATRQIRSSESAELLVLQFSRDVASPEEGHLRRALSFGIDRATLNNVVMQGGGNPAGALLPDWMSGYGFVFPTAFDLAQARQERSQALEPALWSLGYDSTDPLARVVAERVALNARDAGLTLQLTTATKCDVRLVRVPLASLDARVALQELVRELNLPAPAFAGSSQSDLYAAENSLLQSQRVIPLLHLRHSVAMHENVKDWAERADGEWNLQNVWLEAGKP